MAAILSNLWLKTKLLDPVPQVHISVVCTNSCKHRYQRVVDVNNVTAKLKLMGLYINNKAPRRTHKKTTLQTTDQCYHWKSPLGKKKLCKLNVRKEFNLYTSTTEPKPFLTAETDCRRAVLSSRICTTTWSVLFCRGNRSFPNGCTECHFPCSFNRLQLPTLLLQAKKVKVKHEFVRCVKPLTQLPFCKGTDLQSTAR